MHQFSERFQGLSESERAARYVRLADAALRHYELSVVTPTFIQHNGGVTYRLDAADGHPLYLLKIAEMAGEGGGIPRERMVLVMEWLAALGAEGNIVVQEPVRNRQGELVTEVVFPDLDDPSTVTVQRWIEGEHVRDAFTPEQAFRIGSMVARLHAHSSHWTPDLAQHAVDCDNAWLAACLTHLSRVAGDGILTQMEWRTVETAMERLAGIMGALGQGRDIWGAIHGDLHHENLLFHGDSVRPIDFGDFSLGHFPHDLGVILYHVMYLNDVGVRRAIRDGYQSVRALPNASSLWPEAFLCAAALGNLAFQVTIPEERASDHFARNVREFAVSFCADLASGSQFVFG